MSQSDTGIVGSWRVTLYPDAGTTPNQALITPSADGTLIATPPAVEQFPLAPEGVVYVSTCHGAWKATGVNSAAIGFLGQSSNRQGESLGMGSVRSDCELDGDAMTFGGRYAFEMADPTGNIFATEEGMVRGMRITADAPELARVAVALPIRV
jgi:hypothetical protein